MHACLLLPLTSFADVVHQLRIYEIFDENKQALHAAPDGLFAEEEVGGPYGARQVRPIGLQTGDLTATYSSVYASLGASRRQAAYLKTVLPDATVRLTRWSGGQAQVIERGAGAPVLMIHGGLGEAFQWAPLMAQLPQGCKLIAVDRPGHGLSDPFDYRGVDILAHARHFIAEVLDAEGIPRASLVGCSMGGLWAVAFALAHPDRVENLVLVGSPAGAVRGMPLMLRMGMLPGLKTIVRCAMRKPTRDSVRSFWKLLVAHPHQLPAELLDALVASQARNHQSWFTLLDATTDIGGVKRELVLGEAWRRLSVATTLIWGERDAWASIDLGEQIAAGNPKIRLVRVPEAGHAPWFDQPNLVSAAVAHALRS